ncbi:MAG: DUF59 domain-containing protein [Opitutaceae bacterium]|nr:DUF59 domain-containing protein [Opitutaceae bacterium]
MPSRNEYTLSRDVTATLIPAGDEVVLPKGTQVFITQALGGNVTVRTERGLYRISGDDVGAIEGYAGNAAGAAAAASTGPGGAFSEEMVWDVLRTCFDPEIPVNIVDLGLVYDVAVEDRAEGGRAVEVKMTLTAQGCGMGPVIAEDARAKVAALPEVKSARVHIVWDPVWTPQMITPAGRNALGLE